MGVETLGTKVYVAEYGTTVTTYTDIETAISGADQIGCMVDIGSVAIERPTNMTQCITSGDIDYAVGGEVTSPVTLSLKFDALDIAGQATLNSVAKSNTKIVMIYELNDDPGGAVSHPTYFTFDAKVTKREYAFTKDNFVFFNVTITPLSNSNETLAETVTP